MMQDALKAFNNNEYMGAIFVDIEKAFDKVWHSGLLYKLDQLKIPLYLGKWTKSYLTDRFFTVKIDNKNYHSRGTPKDHAFSLIIII